MFSVAGLGAGSHSLSIAWAGKNPSAAAHSFIVVDATAAVADVSVQRFEETDPGFVYSSDWWRWTNGDQSVGFAEVTEVPGGVATLTFSGSVVRWIGQRGPDRAF